MITRKIFELTKESIGKGNIEDALILLSDAVERDDQAVLNEINKIRSELQLIEYQLRVEYISKRTYNETRLEFAKQISDILSNNISDTSRTLIATEFIRSGKRFKNYSKFHTKMIPMIPFIKDNPIKIENILFEYKVMEIFNGMPYIDLYDRVVTHIKDKKTIYNEAKPNYLISNITNNPEENEHYAEITLGISGYTDFLSVNRNLDFKRANNLSIRDQLKQNEVDLDYDDQKNSVPKQLGMSIIIITNDNKLVFQRRQTSEVASRMYHVSIAEGLQVHRSYKDFIQLSKNERNVAVGDKSLLIAASRGLKEELGIEESEVENFQFLSMYFDYELQQPIFQLSCLVDISSSKIESYYHTRKGKDTLSEIGRLDFVNNNLDSISSYLYETSSSGEWSSHAIINIISFFERYYGSEKMTGPTISKYFKKIKYFNLGPQEYISSF